MKAKEPPGGNEPGNTAARIKRARIAGELKSDPTDEELIAEIYHAVITLRGAGITPHIHKIRADLHCPEGDFVAFLLRYKHYFYIPPEKHNNPPIVITPTLESKIRDIARRAKNPPGDD